MSASSPLALRAFPALALLCLLAQPAMAQKGKKPPSLGLTVTLYASSVEVGGSIRGSVTHNSSASVSVMLSSSNPQAASIDPTSLTIPAGTSANFDVEANAVASSVTITAQASGYSSGSATLVITAPTLPVVYRTIWLGSLAFAHGISDSGDIVGSSRINGLSHAFVVPFGGNMLAVSELAANWIDTDDLNLDSATVKNAWRLTSAVAINESGQIAGKAVPASGTSGSVLRAFRFDPIAGEMRLLPSNGGTWSWSGNGDVINETGDVCYADGIAFIYTGNYPGGNQLWPIQENAGVRAIGDGGELLGFFIAADGSGGDGFRYSAALGFETEPFVGTRPINMSPDGNYVIGTKIATTRKGTSSLFRYSNSDGMLLISAAGYATAVNNSGDVVGDGYLYMNGNGANYGLIDLTSHLGYKPLLNSVTSRDETGFPWMCGYFEVNGEQRAVLVYPELRQ